MSVHDAIAALPASGNADHALIRALVTKRMAYCFADNENVTAFTAADPEDGTLPLYLIQGNTLFEYDSTDTTTAHDGVTCLVTADGKRYKTEDVAFPYSVLNSTTTAQPEDPSVGDKYRVATGATGDDWSGKDGKIAIYTARGWVFKEADVGALLYDEDTDSFYHLDADGSWVLGFGEQSLNAGAVLPSNISGGGGKVRWYVENQTTNTPPSEPADLSEYIVGGSPTGDWAGKAGQITRYESGAWVFYVPSEGWVAYDKSQNTDYVFNGTAWISNAGTWIQFGGEFNNANNTTSSGTDTYTYSATTAPSTSERRNQDQDWLTYAAKRTGTKNLRITYLADILWNTGSSSALGNGNNVACLYRDNETSAVDWCAVIPHYTQSGINRSRAAFQFYVSANDTDEHVYKFAITQRYTDANNFLSASQFTRKSFTVEERIT